MKNNINEDEINFSFSKEIKSNENLNTGHSPYKSNVKPIKPTLSVDKEKSNISLVNYCYKHFINNEVYEICFRINFNSYVILRRLLIGSNIDINIFSRVIFEIFDFSGNSWKLIFPFYQLEGSPKSEEIIFLTDNTKKVYDMVSVLLQKLNFKLNDKFDFIYDVFAEKWKIECKIENVSKVKDIIIKHYKTQKDKDLGFIKLKSLFRPILIFGENQAPPEGIGGPKDFMKLIKHKDDLFHPITLKYLHYFQELYSNDENNTNSDKFSIDDILYGFDFDYYQECLGEINYLKFYNQINFENTDKISELKNESQQFDASLLSKDILYYGNDDNLEDESIVDLDSGQQYLNSSDLLLKSSEYDLI